MTATVLVATLLAQAAAGLPTGVITEGLPRELPHRSAYITHGPAAAAFVAETFAPTDFGDDRIPAGGKPWLVLIGPRAGTEQVASQVPDDLRPLVEIRQYEPDDPRLEGKFDQYYRGGTHALVLRPDGRVYWQSLAAVADILRQLNRLLGREPEPSPWDPIPFPSPLPGPDRGGAQPMTVFLAGVVTGWLTAGLLAVAIGVAFWARRTLQSLQRALAQADRAAAPPTPTPPNA